MLGLYPQNGDSNVAVDYVTSLHLMSGPIVMQHICHDVSEKFTTVRFGHVVFTARCYASEVLGQLSLASLRGRLIEYQLRLGVRAGMSPLPGGR